jgi:uncharacterized protein (DUF427 family)
MDAFYEEDERIVGHAADRYHRIDIRQSTRHLVVRSGDRIIAETTQPLVLYESGFAPRWYVPPEDVEESELTPVDTRTFCPYKGVCSYYDVGNARRAAWSYRQPDGGSPAGARFGDSESSTNRESRSPLRAGSDRFPCGSAADDHSEGESMRPTGFVKLLLGAAVQLGPCRHDDCRAYLGAVAQRRGHITTSGIRDLPDQFERHRPHP